MVPHNHRTKKNECRRAGERQAAGESSQLLKLWEGLGTSHGEEEWLLLQLSNQWRPLHDCDPSGGSNGDWAAQAIVSHASGSTSPEQGKKSEPWKDEVLQGKMRLMRLRVKEGSEAVGSLWMEYCPT